ncbi:MerR family transcriptional regulator [Bacillus piscicola]|uniref:MerR family transcriptional regulator n=1 Tax=Bacillus piscicola TaxID=1632684 RepID=UPI001F08FCA1|nr:MerR family transcriptional regulator [Bacillus piscicola]
MEKHEHVFTISEFGKRARTTVRTLRFYEELGLLIPAKQNRSGHKLYGFEDLAKLQQIQSLKFLGYSLQEIKSLMDNKSDDFKQLEESLPWQHKLLTEKKNELNQAIEAVERVQFLLQEGKPITWTILGSLLFQMENEQDQIEWVKEYCSEEVAEQFSSLPKEQRLQMDIEMLDWLTELKKLIRDGASPQSSEALNLAVKLSEITMKHVENKEDAAKQIQKTQESMEGDTMDFKLPNIFTPEEENFLGEVVKYIKSDYGETKQDNKKK